MLKRLADKLILQPSRHPIPAPHKQKRTIAFGAGNLDVWVEHGDAANEEHELFVLKMPGAGGRAERASEHPADVWQHWSTQVWTLNPPGYGGSDGRASVQTLAAACAAVMKHLLRVADGRPIVLAGNSLGTAGALHLAARFPVDGLILRNPPPLRQLIVGRFGWWNFGLGAGLIARQVPSELDSIENARRVEAPAVVMVSQKDSVVPTVYQEKVLDAYGGEQRRVLLKDADHACPPSPDEAAQYVHALGWLADQILLREPHKIQG